MPVSDLRSPLAGRTSPSLRAVLLALWLALVGWLVFHHVFWRDEVRAFSLALDGDGLTGMARAVHGEGHPLLWYLALRLAHILVPVREVLPAMALLFGAGSAALLTLRAPLRPLALVAALFGAWLAHEYTAMARNYGIAVLLCFLLADRMAGGSRNGWTIGALLFLLCNTNVPAVLLAGGFLLFWLVETVAAEGWRPSRAWRDWLIAAGLTMLGTLACFATVYPPVNDAAVSTLSIGLTPRGLAIAALDVASPMVALVPAWLTTQPHAEAIVAVLLVASPFSLARSPGGLIAASVVLPAMTLFFQLVYPAAYRHAALYLAFLVALHWMVAGGRGGRWPNDHAATRQAARIGTAALAAMLFLQVVRLLALVAAVAHGHVDGHARDLAALLERPALRGAIVLADPEPVIETLPYYAANPTWLVREHRFGRVSHFTHRAIFALRLGILTADARALQRATGRPVVIAMSPALDPAAAETVWIEGYGQSFRANRAEVRDFLSATTRIARLAPAMGDESYGVYLLKRPVSGRVTAF